MLIGSRFRANFPVQLVVRTVSTPLLARARGGGEFGRGGYVAEGSEHWTYRIQWSSRALRSDLTEDRFLGITSAISRHRTSSKIYLGEAKKKEQLQVSIMSKIHRLVQPTGWGMSTADSARARGGVSLLVR